MVISNKQKVTNLVTIYIRAIMGDGEKTENTIQEALKNTYTFEKMNAVISGHGKQFTKNVIAALTGIGPVCDALNCMPDPESEKLRIIGDRICVELIKKKENLLAENKKIPES